MWLEDLEGIGDIYRVAHAKTGILKDMRRIHEDEGIVVDDEGAVRRALDRSCGRSRPIKRVRRFGFPRSVRC